MSKPQGLNWGQIMDDYVAKGGILDPGVWNGKPPKVEAAPKPNPRSDPNPPGSRARRHMPKATIDDIVRRYTEDRVSSKTLAEEHGIAPITVTRILRDNGVTVRPRSEKVVLSDEQLTWAKAQYALGRSTLDIGTEIGIQHRTLHRILTEAGVKMRDKSEAARTVWTRKAQKAQG